MTLTLTLTLIGIDRQGRSQMGHGADMKRDELHQTARDKKCRKHKPVVAMRVLGCFTTLLVLVPVHVHVHASCCDASPVHSGLLLQSTLLFLASGMPIVALALALAPNPTPPSLLVCPSLPWPWPWPWPRPMLRTWAPWRSSFSETICSSSRMRFIMAWSVHHGVRVRVGSLWPDTPKQH